MMLLLLLLLADVGKAGIFRYWMVRVLYNNQKELALLEKLVLLQGKIFFLLCSFLFGRLDWVGTKKKI